jgi:hypothetical protein
MRQADYQRFKVAMTGMAKVYERELDVLLLDAYWLALRSWSLQEFEAAAGHLMSTSEFMPRPSAFNALRQAARPTAGEAWAKALHHAAKSGYRKGPLGDSFIDAVVCVLGGYKVIAMCEESRLHFLERRFCEHYEAKQDSEAVRDALPEIAGSSARIELEAPDSLEAEEESDRVGVDE